jgi:hypothetical protein
MIESCDIMTGVALATAGLLGMSGWVWRHAEDNGKRSGAPWALAVFVTGGMGAIFYLLITRRPGIRFLRGVALWGLWTLLIGVGSYSLVIVSASRRGADLRAGAATTSLAAPLVVNPSWGSFDKAFPGVPPQTQPASPSR